MSAAPPDRFPASYWNERYARPGYAYGEAPNAFLLSQAGRFAPRSALLVPADGEGRNGVWLAGEGHDVTTVDLSAIGVAKALDLAERRGVRIAALQADLLGWAWPEGAFDGVVLMFLHLPPTARAAVHARVKAALRPGGLVVLQAFSLRQLELRRVHGSGGPGTPELLYDAAMLRDDFAGLEEVHLAEGEEELAEGAFHAGRAAVIGTVFRKTEAAS